VDGKKEFNISELYRLYMDRDDKPDNLVRRWNNEVHDALEVSSNLVKKSIDLF
jgi:hypothetical protein